MSKKPTVLMILDGYGLSDKMNGNAVAEANTPVMDLDEAENLACIAPFIIIETDDLKEVRIYLNSLSCIKDRSV